MVADQIQFETDSNALNKIATEVVVGGVNPFRAKMLARQYEEEFQNVYAPRPVTAWLCRYMGMFPVNSAFGTAYEGFIAITCGGEKENYTLLAKPGAATENLLAHMTEGKVIKFNGKFFPDVPMSYHTRLNEPGVHVLLILDVPND